jgi:ABC-2 type transport system permease protein
MPTRFQTLLLREWMQHKRGWLITLLAPPSLFLALLTVGNANGHPDASPLGMALIFMMVSTMAVFVIAWLSAMFQLPGLARRDAQDRSIEFWLSLPASHGESIAATVLSHAVLVPLAAVLVGYAFGGVISTALMIKSQGLAGWHAVPWLQVMGLSLPLLARLLFGVLLMSLWLAPLVLMTMAASAWLKRWGMPALILTLGVGGLVLDKFYGLPIVWQLLHAQEAGAVSSLMVDRLALVQQLPGLRSGSFDVTSWAMQDALLAAQQLVSAHFIGGLLVAAGCFALLVLKRSRSS